ncbi:MAG: hypothetical protein R3290_12315 [Acidimicrobiia bacterium]|nr:hypothetical protein [Acidimicrobiia bacterium]
MNITISRIRDRVVEAVNARDPSLLEGIEFREPFEDRLVRIQDRWPRLMMTRGHLAGDPVAVTWIPDTDERYVRTGHVEFVDDPDDGVHVSVVVGADPDLVTEAPAGSRVAEWESTKEIEGARADWV